MKQGQETPVTPSQLIGIAVSECLKRGRKVPADVQMLLADGLNTKGRSIVSSAGACRDANKTK